MKTSALSSTVERTEVRIDSLSKRLADVVIATRYLSRNNNRLKALADRLCAKHLLSWQGRPGVSTLPVKELDPTRMGPEAIKQAVQARREPLVIRDFAAGSRAVERWSPAFFREHYGDTVLKAGGFDAQPLALREIVDRMESGDTDQQVYVQAVADLFVQHPELLDDLPLSKVFGLQKKGYHGAEFFLGGADSASPWHAENEWTFFIMADGQKKWKFIRPEYTLQMVPLFQQDLIYIASKNYFFNDPEEVTTFEVTLNAGDLLIFPPWWWHRVENLSDSSTAACMRFRTLSQQVASPNPLLSMLQLASPHQWYNIISERLTGKPKDDERYLDRSKNIIV